MSRIYRCFTAVMVVWLAAAPCDAATITALGLLPGGGSLKAQSVSRDGRTVVGEGSTAASNREPFLWSAQSGLQGLGHLVENHYGVASAVSADGAVVVGYAYGGNSLAGFRWTVAAGMEFLDNLYGDRGNGFAYDVSDDGLTIVGGSARCGEYTCGEEAATVWSPAGMTALGWLSEPRQRPYGESSATAVSSDGWVIAGTSTSRSVDDFEAFRWTAGEGMVPLGHLPGRDFSSVRGMSTDGAFIVGFDAYGGVSSGDPNSYSAVRWSNDTALVDLGIGKANGVSDDGRIVVGNSFDDDRAWIWDDVHGRRDLPAVLSENYGVDLSLWNLRKVVGISGDGKTLVGDGYYFDGNQWIATVWLAQVPEPSSWVLGIVALACIAGRTAIRPSRLRQTQWFPTCPPNRPVSRWNRRALHRANERRRRRGRAIERSSVLRCPHSHPATYQRLAPQRSDQAQRADKQ